MAYTAKYDFRAIMLKVGGQTSGRNYSA